MWCHGSVVAKIHAAGLLRLFNGDRPGASLSEQIRTRLVTGSLQEIPQDGDARLGENAGALEADSAGQLIEIATEHGDRIGEPREPRIAADFAHRAEDSNGAQLLKDVGIADDGGLEGRRFIGGLVLADDLENGWYFSSGKRASRRTAGAREQA